MDEPWDRDYMLHDTPPLFIKPEQRKLGMQEQKPDYVHSINELAAAVDYIGIEDVIKVHLVVGTVINAKIYLNRTSFLNAS